MSKRNASSGAAWSGWLAIAFLLLATIDRQLPEVMGWLK